MRGALRGGRRFERQTSETLGRSSKRHRSSIAERPPHPRRFAPRLLPARGENAERKAFPFSRCVFASEVCCTLQESPSNTPQITKGGGAPKGAYAFCRARRGPARATRTNVATRPRFGPRSPFGGSQHRRHSPRRTHPDIGSAPVPRLPETRPCGALPRITLSQSTALRGDRSSCRSGGDPRPPGERFARPPAWNRTCSTF